MMVQQIKATAGNRLTCQHNVSDIRICKKKNNLTFTQPLFTGFVFCA